jgi:1,4-alpha-glucan branching enzyme
MSSPHRARLPTPRSVRADPESPPLSASPITDDDLYLFNEGSHYELYEKMGAHPMTIDGWSGTFFAVWAPNADRVSVIGDFNQWQRDRNFLTPRANSGIFEGFIREAHKGSIYKYDVVSRYQNYRAEKADPYGLWHEVPPATASVVWDLDYEWADQDWMRGRGGHLALDAPVSIYEMHFGSWRRVPEEASRSLSYREAIPFLTDYIQEMGYTHVEFMPLTEHPFYGSWGYEPIGMFAPTSRYGTPQDLMALIDALHQGGIGVIMDWVPSHFPTDAHGLGYFDGTHLYEHSDPRRGFHPDWNTFIFNFGRHEVQSFLTSSAMLWLERYHVDGLRVDGVASMLYLDYSRQSGQWIPNDSGGRENWEAIAFLRRLNEFVYRTVPGAQMIAEESTAWPMVSRPTSMGGLGFGYKWDMGWMHDTLQYFSLDPLFRQYHQDELSFRMIYAYHENFILPLSHDEVVYGKGSIYQRMPGDQWQKMANLRLLYAYMFALPAKKLLFMGDEFGQSAEWRHDESLDWHLLQYAPHRDLREWVRWLNEIYRNSPALYVRDYDTAGFEWIDTSDRAQSVLSFVRKGHSPSDQLVAVFNLTPLPRTAYRIGVPDFDRWTVIANSDDAQFGGSGAGSTGSVVADTVSAHGRPRSVELDLPPLGALYLVPER